MRNFKNYRQILSTNGKITMLPTALLAKVVTRIQRQLQSQLLKRL